MTTQTPLRVLMLGAASGIAQATARLYAAEGAVIGLAGRNSERLGSIAADLAARGAGQTEIFELDLVSAEPSSALAGMVAKLGGIDHVILAYGVLGDQALAERDLAAAEAILDVNFRSAAGWSPMRWRCCSSLARACSRAAARWWCSARWRAIAAGDRTTSMGQPRPALPC